MSEENSILDKLIHSKQMNEAYQFKSDELVDEFLKNLSSKEKEILAKRFGLNGHEPHTLEQIGAKHQITRERIRQIQNAAIKKIRELQNLQETLEFINHTISRQIQDYGGVMEDKHFLDELLSYSGKSGNIYRSAEFIVSQLLHDKIERIKKSTHLLPGWKLRSLAIEHVHEILEEMEKIIREENKLIETQELIERFKNSDYFREKSQNFMALGITDDNDIEDEKINQILESYLHISKKINKNLLGKWGLTKWPTISPKRMGDKIYLILTKKEEPLHFTEISNEINHAKFDKKIAYPATIHNELILDDRYVLVGRGIYALKEWGYKSGTVSDVIEEILKDAKEPISKQQILDEVSKKRIVKKSTIYLALSNREKFNKVGDKYALKG